MNNIEITNQLFEAIQTIVNESIRHLPYDRTVVASIVANGNKEYGEYQVKTRKGSTFLAYSDDNSYKVNDEVYVLIPSGDYSERKFILSKYITGTELIDNDLIQNNSYISSAGKKADWSQIIKNYKMAKTQEESKELLNFFISQKENEEIDKLSSISFGVNFKNLEDFLKETYGFNTVTAAVRQYLVNHPEIVETAVNEYLETKE